jgi:hypothetical protein
VDINAAGIASAPSSRKYLRNFILTSAPSIMHCVTNRFGVLPAHLVILVCLIRITTISLKSCASLMILASKLLIFRYDSPISLSHSKPFALFYLAYILDAIPHKGEAVFRLLQ